MYTVPNASLWNFWQCQTTFLGYTNFLSEKPKFSKKGSMDILSLTGGADSGRSQLLFFRIAAVWINITLLLSAPTNEISNLNNNFTTPPTLTLKVFHQTPFQTKSFLELQVAIHNLEGVFANATKSQKLQEIQGQLKKEKDGFMEKIRSDLRAFRQKMDDTSQMLREANSRFIKGFK